MHVKNVHGEHKFFGSMTIGPKGQVVIPASARKELGLDTGATLLVFETPFGEGLFLLKADALEQVLAMMSKRLAQFEQVLGEHKVAGGSKEKEK